MFDEKSHSLKMDKSIEAFSKELSSLRTGRANAAMLDIVRVDVYGQQMPINQIGSITTPEPRMINVQVWDQNNVPLVDAAIKKSELGLNPQIDGQLIRLPVPELNEERRNELKKLIKSMGEKCKISIRNIRRDANEEINSSLEAAGVDGFVSPPASGAPTPTPSGSHSSKKGKKYAKKGKARKKAKSTKEGKYIKKAKYYKNEKNSKRV